MIEDKGEMSFSESNDANIPINVWLVETEDNDGKRNGTWTLRADNFMPRMSSVGQAVYETISDKREELVELIKLHVLPLYETAVVNLQAVCEGKSECLYYWKK